MNEASQWDEVEDAAKYAAVILRMKEWCESNPDQWVMRSDVLDMLDACLAADTEIEVF